LTAWPMIFRDALGADAPVEVPQSVTNGFRGLAAIRKNPIEQFPRRQRLLLKMNRAQS
jgi:hypothetical protein